MHLGVWRDDSTIKNTSYSCRGPMFGTQHPQSDSQPFVTTVLESSVPSSDYHRQQAWHGTICTFKQGTHTHKINKCKKFERGNLCLVFCVHGLGLPSTVGVFSVRETLMQVRWWLSTPAMSSAPSKLTSARNTMTARWVLGSFSRFSFDVERGRQLLSWFLVPNRNINMISLRKVGCCFCCCLGVGGWVYKNLKKYLHLHTLWWTH